MAWGIWAIAALVLLIIEMFTVDFTFLMLASGALAAAITAFVTPSWPIQLVAFAVVATLLLLFVRPIIRRRINGVTKEESNVYALAGKQATTLTQVTPSGGRARVDGDEWSAKSASGVIPEGAHATILSVDGVHLVLSAVE